MSIHLFPGTNQQEPFKDVYLLYLIILYNKLKGSVIGMLKKLRKKLQKQWQDLLRKKTIA